MFCSVNFITKKYFQAKFRTKKGERMYNKNSRLDFKIDTKKQIVIFGQTKISFHENRIIFLYQKYI